MPNKTITLTIIAIFLLAIFLSAGVLSASKSTNADRIAKRLRGFTTFPIQDDEVLVAFESGDPDRPIVVGTIPTSASVDMYIKIDGVDGESSDANHDKWIDVLMVNLDFSKDDEIGQFTFWKETDASTPKLMLSCNKGSHVGDGDGTATFELCRDVGRGRDAERECFLTLEFEGVKGNEAHLDSFAWLSDESRPMESYTFTYNKVEFTYLQDDGSEETSVIEFDDGRA